MPACSRLGDIVTSRQIRSPRHSTELTAPCSAAPSPSGPDLPVPSFPRTAVLTSTGLSLLLTQSWASTKARTWHGRPHSPVEAVLLLRAAPGHLPALPVPAQRTSLCRSWPGCGHCPEPQPLLGFVSNQTSPWEGKERIRESTPRLPKGSQGTRRFCCPAPPRLAEAQHIQDFAVSTRTLVLC